MRRHPPRLAIGAEQSIPDRLADRPTRTQLEVRVPADLDHLFVAAPLAYYLGTSVSVGADDPALVGAEPLRTFDRLPAFQDQVARLLPGIFALDAALRSTDGAADPPLPTELRAAAPVDRLARYLDLLADRDPSPTWHLSTYVDPTVERAACLPYLLDRLSLVYLAESTPLDGQDLLQRALDDFFRAPADAPSVDPLDPELRRGAAHAWLAEGTPIDAFTTSAVAHRNRLAAAGTGGPMTVDLVVNDAEMDAERSVAAVYREGLAGHPIEVTVHEGVPTADLARLFEAAGDLLHYVGHCEVDGLVCPDGPLDAGSLDDVDTRAVFLNACGSVHEGRRLVRAGAAAGAVTLTAVLDDQAATVGTAFARLLGAGLTVERALRVARTGVMMGKDYAVVGDGTLTVAPAYGHPGVLVVEPTAGAFEAEYRVVSPQGAGRRYPDPFGEGRRLYGRVATASLARDELVTFCRRRSVPVVYDGEVTSTEAVLATLT